MPLLNAKCAAGGAWWVLVAVLQCHCAASPTLVPPASGTEARPLEGTHSPPAGATSRAELSPWPGIAALSAPPHDEQCTYLGTQPWLSWQRKGDQLVPERTAARPLVVDALPFASPAVLDVAEGSGGTRSVVKVENGWLVAVNRGEFGGGLFWVRAGTLEAQPLDQNLVDSVRWVGMSKFGILGVAGLCHGDACTLRTSVYEVSRSVEGQWRLRPSAVLKGCPAAVSLDSASESLVVAAPCGALSRLDANGTREVAVWPLHLGPTQVVVTGGTSSAEADYYVSFGRVVARFRAGHAQWFAPLECATVVTEPTGRCGCVGAPVGTAREP
jgi:hypothetical protein